MHIAGYIVTFLLGTLVGVLFYRNNANKAKAQADELVRLYEIAAAAAAKEIAQLRTKSLKV